MMCVIRRYGMLVNYCLFPSFVHGAQHTAPLSLVSQKLSVRVRCTYATTGHVPDKLQGMRKQIGSTAKKGMQ